MGLDGFLKYLGFLNNYEILRILIFTDFSSKVRNFSAKNFVLCSENFSEFLTIEFLPNILKFILKIFHKIRIFARAESCWQQCVRIKQI